MRVGLLRRQFQSDPLRPSARGRRGARGAQAGPGLFRACGVAAAQTAEGELAPAEHRLAMVRLATKGNRHFMVSDVEIRRAGRSYTIDTVRHFLTTLRAPSTLFLMMGSDAVCRTGHLERLRRAGSPDARSRCIRGPSDGDGRPPRISLAALKRFGYIREDDHYVHPSGQTLSFVATTNFPISATLIREKLHRHHSDPLPDAGRRGRLYSAARAVLTAPVFSQKSFNKTICSLSAAARRLAASPCSA